MAYSDKVVDHYNNPRNVGSLSKEDPNVGTGLVGAPECGDVMKLQMSRRGAFDQEHGHRARALAPAGEDSLLRACRRRHQGRHRRLEEKERHCRAGCGKSVALSVLEVSVA